jgi:hypothetical protein
VTQPVQEPTLGDMIIEDLESQLAETDPKYARKCKELAVTRSQYRQLLQFVQSKADILGLSEAGAEDLSEAPAEAVDDTAPPAKEGPAAKTPPPPVNGSKAPPKETAAT